MFNMMFAHKMKSQIIEPVVSSPLILKVWIYYSNIYFNAYIGHCWMWNTLVMGEYFCNGVLLWKSFAFEPLSNQPVIHTLRWLCAHFMTYNEPHNNCFMINLKLAQSHKWNQLDWPLISCLLEWNQCCVSIKMCFDQMAQQSNKRKPEINRTEIASNWD